MRSGCVGTDVREAITAAISTGSGVRVHRWKTVAVKRTHTLSGRCWWVINESRADRGGKAEGWCECVYVKGVWAAERYERGGAGRGGSPQTERDGIIIIMLLLYTCIVYET